VQSADQTFYDPRTAQYWERRGSWEGKEGKKKNILSSGRPHLFHLQRARAARVNGCELSIYWLQWRAGDRTLQWLVCELFQLPTDRPRSRMQNLYLV